MITVNYSVIITVSRQRDWSKLGNFAIVPRVVSACQSGLHSQSQSFKSQFAKAAALNCRLGCRAPADGSLMTGSLMTPSIWLTFAHFQMPLHAYYLRQVPLRILHWEFSNLWIIALIWRLDKRSYEFPLWSAILHHIGQFKLQGAFWAILLLQQTLSLAFCLNDVPIGQAPLTGLSSTLQFIKSFAIVDLSFLLKRAILHVRKLPLLKCTIWCGF